MIANTKIEITDSVNFIFICFLIVKYMSVENITTGSKYIVAREPAIRIPQVEIIAIIKHELLKNLSLLSTKERLTKSTSNTSLYKSDNKTSK